MPMKTKTMEFENVIVTYDYGAKLLTVEAKENTKSFVRDEAQSKGTIQLNDRAISELVESLAGIGRQVPETNRDRY